MIISFSGSQSSGKSTLLNYLRTKDIDNSYYPPITFIPEITRLVKRKYNLPINEAGTDLTQLLIANEHLVNCLLPAHQNNVTILDRCIVDGLIYTKWLWDNKKVTEQTYRSVSHIYDLIHDKYDIIFYTSPKDIALEDDGERSIDKKFRDDIIKAFEEHIKDLKNVVVLEGSVQQRLDTIKETLAKHNIHITI
jgi:nicotinamide riboside kinase